MGFFSTRKADDINDSHQLGLPMGVNGEKASVVQVIRSRFYGKKGKEREGDPPSYLASVSAAAYAPPVVQNPVASAPPTPGKAGPSILRLDLDRPLPSLPNTPSKRRPSVNTPTTPARSPTKPNGTHAKNESTASLSSSPRKNADAVTATLAQRLNALAVANADGLLNDDEYRILRQNLFERFSSNAAVPTETHVVPLAAPQPRPRKGGPTPDRPSSRPLSNFHVERPISVAESRTSVSGMADLFRRATGKRSGSKDMSDAASVWSSSSKTSFFRIPSGLRKKSSTSSIHTTSSRIHADQISLSSKGPTSDRGHGDNTLISPASRSAASIRQLATPPSSFPGSGSRRAGQEHRNTNSIYDVFHEDHLQSVKDIKQEIMNIEAESKRLMDAFNGLEVTTLAKTQRHRSRPSLKSAEIMKSSTAGSNWGGDSDGLSQRRVQIADDAMSVRSITSVGTTPSVAPSMARSAYSAKKATRVKIAPPSPLQSNGASYPSSLHRKNSLSSVTSDRRGKMLPPPLPALPNSISQGHLRAASGSNISLVRSTGHLPMNTVLEDEKMSVAETAVVEVEEVETELEDIRRRREEVSQRYDARLEYLRAKLKGAQLHEKLMRK